MKKIAITGLNGVIGYILSEEISSEMQIIDLYHKTKYQGKTKIKQHTHLDLSKTASIAKVLERVNPDVIIHLAAVTHIDKCEKDRKNGKKGIVWKTNVEGSFEIAKFCAKNNILLVFLSTECVFDGKQKYFSEDAKKNPINWYGVTKSEAENLILSTKANAAIIRSVVAYHENDKGRTIYGKFLQELKLKKKVFATTDQLFTPTYTYDIVRAINKVIENKLSGIYHVTPGKSLSPYKFALLVAKKNKYPASFVKATILSSYYDKSRAELRLKNACLSGQRSNRILKFTPKNPEKVL